MRPAWPSQRTAAKAASHSLRSLTAVTQRKPTKPNRTAAGAFGNDLLAGRLVFLIPEMMFGGCKNALPICDSSCSEDTVNAGTDKDTFPLWSILRATTNSQVPTVGAAKTAVAAAHIKSMQK